MNAEAIDARTRDTLGLIADSSGIPRRLAAFRTLAAAGWETLPTTRTRASAASTRASRVGQSTYTASTSTPDGASR
ncbi:hypothetical protein AKJ09_09562 [Labilithrix luteola]|uniref:Uncharacterized protein n=1 Tax=Labilithrix luteola TaxID=1391654 RepID=A0A0K1QAY5_9BACT|nr:hypothetical protein AKJ09_09562 [Labilithrix luteola]